ncbi:MAG TPA: glycine C-acetyltransferase [Candidatus Aquilonibacter sp.]|nr:glycine C-acetyltransferase [Candidatus Aquilonibacter sp.]
MFDAMRAQYESQLADIRSAGLYKSERILESPQNVRVDLPSRKSVLNLCANNYLGLSDHPEIVKAAHDALERWGYGLSSVRFICGTQQIHKQLERRLSEFLGAEDTILYSSCFDANGGLFETLLDAEDAVISDELNHASIIDGIRLSKAQRLRYRNGDMDDLEAKLKEASQARRKLIATDGVFSMDGYIARLPQICDLADRYNAMVMVDDSHAVGFMGRTGKGTHEHHHVMGRVDILTGTLGKALGGASGGYVSARKEIIDLLRQRSRPYLFSNSVAPMIVGASLKVLDLITRTSELRDRLFANTRFFRQKLAALGFNVLPGEHPIVPVMFGDAVLAAKAAERLLEKGIYVIPFSYPVVPRDKARIRVQISAAHTREDLEFAVEHFASIRA